MRAWILPDEYDAIDAEASHLIYEADNDKVRSLDIFEQLEKLMHEIPFRMNCFRKKKS